jgi:hypothetical protein
MTGGRGTDSTLSGTARPGYGLTISPNEDQHKGETTS